MHPESKTKVFYIHSQPWVEPAMGGVIIALMSFILHYHFFYLHCYLLIASLICILLSYRQYSVLREHHLDIFLGVKPPGITVALDQIKMIKCEILKINGVWGARVPNVIKDIPCIIIGLNTPLGRQYDPQKINTYECRAEDRKIDIAEDGSSITLYQPPKGGFRPFVDELSQSVQVLNPEIFEYERKYPNWGEVISGIVQSVCIIIFLLIFYKILNK